MPTQEERNAELVENPFAILQQQRDDARKAEQKLLDEFPVKLRDLLMQ